MISRAEAASSHEPAASDPQSSGVDAGADGFAIQRRSLHGSVADHLRAMIIRGDLAPGEKVPPQALAQSLGVSLTPLREALKVLAEEQLVVLGQCVADVTIDDLHLGLEMELVLDTLFEDDDNEHVVWKWQPVGWISKGDA